MGRISEDGYRPARGGDDSGSGSTSRQADLFSGDGDEEALAREFPKSYERSRSIGCLSISSVTSSEGDFSVQTGSARSSVSEASQASHPTGFKSPRACNTTTPSVQNCVCLLYVTFWPLDGLRETATPPLCLNRGRNRSGTQSGEVPARNER
eukprot:1623413-Pyramimonas_sp.AAC.1